MNKISIQSHARIHIALLNQSGYLGRIDGGIGFSLKSPSWSISVEKNKYAKDELSGNTELDKEIRKLKRIFIEKYDLPEHIVSLPKLVEAHIGLGSKTSLLMGIGKATNELFGLGISSKEIAIMAKRGGTSGVGYWASQEKGVVWDSGRKYPEEKSHFIPSSISTSEPPSLITSISLKDFYVCHFRFSEIGIYGKAEISLFNKFCPLSHDSSKELLSIVSGLLIPSLQSSSEAGIQNALSIIQSLGLKKIEWDHQDENTLLFREYWKSLETDIALGLSSMGPTMYCITKKPDLVKRYIEEYPKKPFHYQKTQILNGNK